ncbi:MAG: hypothetical protein FJ319_02045 [SAR202 cluster bacterium]|nr:hypothetical protein [SAR202 cluster bacterium]
MCAGTIEIAAMAGSAKGANGWFHLAQAQVVSDHPYHAQMDEALIIDFTNPERGASARVSVELSAESARALIKAIEAALSDGELRHGH